MDFQSSAAIRTTGFRDDLWMDLSGAPITSAATMTERLRRPNYGTLDLEITVDDPKTFTRPWTVSMVSFRQGCVKPPDSRFLLGQEAADGGSADLKLAGYFRFADSFPV